MAEPPKVVLGEGPVHDAVASRERAVATDAALPTRWTQYSAALTHTWLPGPENAGTAEFPLDGIEDYSVVHQAAGRVGELLGCAADRAPRAETRLTTDGRQFDE